MAKKSRQATQGSSPNVLSFRWQLIISLAAAAVILGLGFTGRLDFTQNWWALLIFIPALLLLVQSALYYRVAGKLERESVGRFVLGIFAAVLAVLFMVEENVGQAWPSFLIAAAASFFIVMYRSRKK